MPANSKFSKTQKNGRKSTVLSPHRPLSGSRLPSAQKFRLRYFENVSLNPTAGTTAYHVFSANGIYDPNITGTGHQPRGFDQLMAWYNHYTVIGAKATAKFCPPTLTGIGVQIGSIGVYADTTDVATLTASLGHLSILEDGKSAKPIINGSTSNSNMCGQEVSVKFDFKTFFGKSADPLYDLYRGSVSANPAEEAYFIVWVAAFDGSTDTDATTVLMEIEYDVLFTEPKPLPSS